MMEAWILALVPAYEEAALEARSCIYLWMTWPDVWLKVLQIEFKPDYP